MVTVTINSETKNWPEDASEMWITQRINRIRRDGVHVCVQVSISTSGVNVGLTTPGCGGAGGGRQPNQKEEEVIALWKALGLSDTTFAAGNVVAFLKRFSKAAAA